MAAKVLHIYDLNLPNTNFQVKAKHQTAHNYRCLRLHLVNWASQIHAWIKIIKLSNNILGLRRYVMAANIPTVLDIAAQFFIGYGQYNNQSHALTKIQLPVT
eukprot:18122_1